MANEYAPAESAVVVTDAPVVGVRVIVVVPLAPATTPPIRYVPAPVLVPRLVPVPGPVVPLVPVPLLLAPAPAVTPPCPQPITDASNTPTINDLSQAIFLSHNR